METVVEKGGNNMSRLFCIVESDGRLRPERITIYKKAEIDLRWGSTKESKQLIKAEVEWKEGEEKPTIKITTDEDVNVQWNTEESNPSDERGSSGWN